MSSAVHTLLQHNTPTQMRMPLFEFIYDKATLFITVRLSVEAIVLSWRNTSIPVTVVYISECIV